MRMPIQHLPIGVLFFYVIYYICVVLVLPSEFGRRFFFFFEWCAHTVYSHIKVSLSLITANHRVRTYTIDFFHFFPFFTFSYSFNFGFANLSCRRSTATELQLLLPPCSTLGLTLSTFNVRLSDCFNYNYGAAGC